jgi:hypothetical protein
MSDRPIDPLGAFELRLGRELRTLSDPALRFVDATELAHALATSGPSSRMRGLPWIDLGRRLGSRRPARLAAALVAAAVVVAVGGIGLAVLKQSHGVAANPTPTLRPSASASPSTDRAVVDMTEIQSSWKSVGTRKARFVNGNHSTDVDAQLNIVIGPGTVTITELRDEILNSVALDRAGGLQVRLLSAAFDWTCRIGDVGEYGVRLSPGGETMTLTPLNDACRERAAILVGRWDRTDIGPLLAGNHVSKLFRPFGTSGQLSYAVPTGWEETDECAGCFRLYKSKDPSGLSISLMADVAPTTEGPLCRDMVAGAGSTPAGIATWLASIQNLKVSKPTPISVGGLSGVSVDLSVRSDAATKCAYLADGNGDVALADPDGLATLSVPGTGRDRYLLLDRGDGRMLAIIIESEGAAWTAAVAEAMNIVQTFEFAR